MSHPLAGKLVAVSRTDTRDTYYGTLADVDAAFAHLTDYQHGWHGQAGWWFHGGGDDISIGLGVVSSIRGAASKPTPGR